MFNRPAPESTAAANNPFVQLEAMAALSPEEIEKRCQIDSSAQLQVRIEQLERMVAVPENILSFFQKEVGYPSRAGTLHGIAAYASGKVRQNRVEVDGVFKEWGVEAPIKSEAEKQKDEESLATAEALAQQYQLLARIAPKLEAHLNIMRVALINKLAQEHPENARCLVQ
jgi:hypothetical protein